MKTFKIYKHPVFEYEAVKSGVSFPLLFFIVTVIPLVQFWMVYKKLWIQFWIWSIYLILAFYFYSLGQYQEWVLDGTNKVYWLFASALIYIFYPFIYGNTWLENSLDKEGYQLVDVVQAKNKKRAIEIAEYNYKNPDEKVESELLSTSDNVADAAILIIIAFVVIMVMLN